MKTILLTILFSGLCALRAEEPSTSVPKADPAAQVFFTKLVERLENAGTKTEPVPRCVLKSEEKTDDPGEQAARVWLEATLVKSERATNNWNPTGKWSVTFVGEKLTNPNVLQYYQPRLLKVVLDPKKEYLGFRFYVEGMVACPEWHGLIDPEGPKLITLFEDGGG